MRDFERVATQLDRVRKEAGKKGQKAGPWLILELARAWARLARLERTLGELHESLASLRSLQKGVVKVTGMRAKGEQGK